VLTLNGGHVVLRPWKRGDESQIVELANNLNVTRYLRESFPSPYTLQDATSWIYRNEAAGPKTHFAIIVDRQLAGGIGFQLHKGEERIVAEMGFWLGEPFWGHGIATVSCQALTEYAFKHHELKRIQSFVLHPKIASRRVLEKSRYNREGILRKAVIKGDDILDVYVYARVR